MHYLKMAKALAFLILNVVQLIDMGRSTMYTARNFRRKR